MPNFRSIRVAHVTATDGSLRYLLANQLTAIMGAGYNVMGVSTDGPHVAYLAERGIAHHAVHIPRKISPLADLSAIRALASFFRRAKIEIVHTHTPKPGLLGQLAARLAGVPIVINTLHGFYFTPTTPRLKRTFFTTMEKIAGHCSDLVLSQNAEDIDTAVVAGILPKGRIQWLGNGIDLERFSPSRLDLRRQEALRSDFGLTDGAVIGFVGRHVREKGLLELFQAMQIVLKEFPTAQLLSVGRIDDDRGDAVSPSIATDYGIETHCRFVGVQQDMPHVISLMDVLVLPSHREGFPRAPMEAAAMSIPTVVTNVRGCRDTVEDGQNGFLIPVNAPERLAQSIVRLLSDPQLAEQMGRRGRAKAALEFDEQIVFRRVLNAYDELVRAKGLR